MWMNGRSGGIRTHDPYTPSIVRYQAALRSGHRQLIATTGSMRNRKVWCELSRGWAVANWFGRRKTKGPSPDQGKIKTAQITGPMISQIIGFPAGNLAAIFRKQSQAPGLNVRFSRPKASPDAAYIRLRLSQQC